MNQDEEQEQPIVSIDYVHGVKGSKNQQKRIKQETN